MASMPPRTSPWPTSVPGLIATSNQGSTKAGLCEDKGALELLPPVDRASQATTQAIVDVLPQLLPLPSITDIATASPSQ